VAPVRPVSAASPRSPKLEMTVMMRLLPKNRTDAMSRNDRQRRHFRSLAHRDRPPARVRPRAGSATGCLIRPVQFSGAKTLAKQRDFRGRHAQSLRTGKLAGGGRGTGIEHSPFRRRSPRTPHELFPARRTSQGPRSVRPDGFRRGCQGESYFRSDSTVSLAKAPVSLG
jgi:hypothetical protein